MTAGPDGGAGDSGWRRLHPLTPLARGWSALALGWAVLMGNGGYEAITRGRLTGAALLTVVAGVAAVGYGAVAWRLTRYRLVGADLQVETGVLVRRSRRVPLARLQGVDVVRPPVARLLGLAELRLEVSGGSETEAPLAYLATGAAAALRAELLDRAAGVARGASATGPAAAAAESAQPAYQVLVRVPAPMLLGSLLLAPATVVAVLTGAAAMLAAWATGDAGALGLLLPAAVAGGGTVLRGFVRDYGLTVALAGDGLRVRRGLLETRSQTVPAGRVHAVEIDQPMLWRLPGWARVRVTVAGYAGHDEEDSSGTLLPVASRATAFAVLRRLLPGADPEAVTAPPPERARRRLPVRWRFLGMSVDDGSGTAFVTRSGRWRRRLCVVPHARIQSLRVSQGPWQARLRLASLHVDTMSGPVHASAPHRDVGDAVQAALTLAAKARTARQRGPAL